MIGYELHPEAFDDIDEIAAYIGQHSLEAAHRVVDEIYVALSGLVPFPHSGHRRPDLTSRPVRFIHVRDSALVVTRRGHSFALWRKVL